MSYRSPATLAAAPPVTGPRKRSPGWYAGIAGTALLVLVGSLVALYLLSMGVAIATPLDKSAVLTAMQGVPPFDDAVYDEIQTKIQTRIVLPTTIRLSYPAEKSSVIAYKSFSQPYFIAAWYDAKMQERGYSIVPDFDSENLPVATHHYRRGDEMVLVQAQRAPNKEDSSVVIYRFNGYRGNE
ncbi:MAG: hypothetical protein SFU56_22295 [Capsulimonadales bacterium]|nr:hypothetical protein [Capsulimonadales bacterium]